VLLNAPRRSQQPPPTNIVNVYTRDGEWFPVKKALLRPCIALTKVRPLRPGAGRGCCGCMQPAACPRGDLLCSRQAKALARHLNNTGPGPEPDMRCPPILAGGAQHRRHGSQRHSGRGHSHL
jgi:hypothetical protein